MFMYDYNTGIKYRLLTEPQPLAMTWDKFLETTYWIYSKIYEAGQDDVWSEYYKAVATSQQETSDIPMNKPEESEQAAGVEKEDKPEEPIIPKAEDEFFHEGTTEEPENTEEEKEEIEAEPENPKAEEEREDEELPFPDDAERETTHVSPDDPLPPGEEEEAPQAAADNHDTVQNQGAFKNAKDALVRLNQAFEDGYYHRAMDMADAFSMHLDIALRRTV